MPLTPAEVHNVAFKKPPIGKRGYDEEEVDAFLDVVEVELSRLIEENNELRARASGAAGVISGADTSVISGADSGVDAEQLRAARDEAARVQDENHRMQAHIDELQQALSQGNDETQQQLVAVRQQLAETEQQLAQSREQVQSREQQPQPAVPLTAEDHHKQAVQVLALAQQTADQHLAQAKTEAERLLTDAQQNAQATVADANERYEKQVGEAQQRADQLDRESTARAQKTVRDAEQRKITLERTVEELRTFEREYRSRLRSYLESQLRDLDASGRAEPAGGPSVNGQSAADLAERRS